MGVQSSAPLSLTTQLLDLHLITKTMKSIEAAQEQRDSNHVISPGGGNKQQKPGMDFRKAAEHWAKKDQPRILAWLEVLGEG